MLRDTASYSTKWTSNSTERSSLLSKVFDFDPEIQSSRIYQANVRSLIRLKQAIGRRPRSSTQATRPKVRDSNQETSHDLQSSVLWEEPVGEQATKGESVLSSRHIRFAQTDTTPEIRVGIPVYGERGSGVSTILEQMALSGTRTQTYDDIERETWREIIFSDMTAVFGRIVEKWWDVKEIDLWSGLLAATKLESFDSIASSTMANVLQQLWYKEGFREDRHLHETTGIDE